MNEQVLYASDVNIKTATIEVKVMKIGNRQVTLAVFRQLPEESLIDLDTGELRGVAWGRVNYHVGCDGMHMPHMHIVWQKAGELRRSVAFCPWKVRDNINIPQNAYRSVVAKVEKLLPYYYIARTLEGWRPDGYLPDPIAIKGITLNSHDYLYPRMTWEAMRDVWRSGMTACTPGGHEYETSNTSSLRESLASIASNSDEVYEMLCNYIEETNILSVMETWQASYAQLEALDQLFIAV